MNNINSLNPAMSIIAEDFNGKCSKWHSSDTIDNIGKEIDIVTLSVDYTQVIDKPNNFINHSSSCIGLIFISNPTIN